MGHNGVGATKDGQRSAKLERQDCNPKQVCLESNGQMSTLLLHIVKVIRMNGRVPESLLRIEEIPFIPAITQLVQSR